MSTQSYLRKHWIYGDSGNENASRREFFQCVAAVCCCPVMDSSGTGATLEENGTMYGLINKIISAPSHRADLIAILKESSEEMPGCLSYVIAEDAADENGIWVTEIWDSEASHQASLSLPRVKEGITSARAMIAGFSRTALTRPVFGVQSRGQSK